MPAEKPLPWDHTEDAEWTSAVNAWPWKAIGGGDWAKSGSCPRCHHEVTVEKVTVVYADRGPDQGDGDLVRARCDCGEPHPGRPADVKTGCGRSGWVDRPPEDE